MRTTPSTQQILALLFLLSSHLTTPITALPTQDSSADKANGIEINPIDPNPYPDPLTTDKSDGIVINPIDEKTSPDPYHQGTCALKLTSSSTPNTATTGEYNLLVQLFDDSRIGMSPRPDFTGLFTSENPLVVKSKLEDEMKVTPGKDFGASFELGQQKWDTGMRDEDSVPSCSEPEDLVEGSQVVGKIVYCKFVCHWGGGKSSDGSN